MTTKVKPTGEKWGGDQEANKCEFCGVVKPVQRYYLRIKNKHFDDNKCGRYSTFIYYCQDCGVEDTLSVQDAKAEERGRIIAEIEKFKKVDNDCQHGPSDSCDSNCTYQHEHQDYNQIISDVLGKL